MSSTTINITATDQKLSLSNYPYPTIASGGYNEDKIKFTLSDEWDDLTVKALFWRDGGESNPYRETLDSNNEVVIPSMVLSTAGTLYISLCGVDEDETEVHTSSIVKYKIVEGKNSSSTDPLAPIREEARAEGYTSGYTEGYVYFKQIQDWYERNGATQNEFYNRLGVMGTSPDYMMIYPYIKTQYILWSFTTNVIGTATQEVGIDISSCTRLDNAAFKSKTNVKKLILTGINNFNTLSNSGWQQFLYGCNQLKEWYVDKLSAVTLSSKSYSEVFRYCSALLTIGGYHVTYPESYLSDTEPESPTDKQVWLDNSGDNTIVKQYSSTDTAWQTILTVGLDEQTYPEGMASNTAPTSPVNNQLWIDTTITPHRVKIYNSTKTVWIEICTVKEVDVREIDNDNYGEIDFTDVTNTTNMFSGCSALKNVRFAYESLNTGLNISATAFLTKESTLSILNGLHTWQSGETHYTINFHATWKEENLDTWFCYFDDEAQAYVDCTSAHAGAMTYSMAFSIKGWTI